MQAQVHPSIHRLESMQSHSLSLTHNVRRRKKKLKHSWRVKHHFLTTSLGQELHQDGNPHIHAVVTYKRKLNVKSSRFFDLDEYHGNVQPARNMQALKVYITKEDPEPLTSDNSSDEETDNLYDLARVTPEETFFEVCRKKKVSIHPKLDPFMYAHQAFQKIQRDASVNTIPEGYIVSGTITCESLQNLQLPGI